MPVSQKHPLVPHDQQNKGQIPQPGVQGVSPIPPMHMTLLRHQKSQLKGREL